MCVTKRPYLEKMPKPEIPIIIVCAYSSKNTKLAETPIFIVFQQAPQKEIFPKLNLNKKTILAPFFEKGHFSKIGR